MQIDKNAVAELNGHQEVKLQRLHEHIFHSRKPRIDTVHVMQCVL